MTKQLVSVKPQLSIIMQYIHELEIEESFLDFQIYSNKSAEEIANKIISVLNKTILKTN